MPSAFAVPQVDHQNLVGCSVPGAVQGRVELYIDRGDKDENKAIFDALHAQKTSIESTFGKSLIWERLDDKRASRVKYESAGDPFDDAQLALTSLTIDTMIKFEAALKEPLAQIQRKLRAWPRAPITQILRDAQHLIV